MILTELPLESTEKFFERNLPVLGIRFGALTLGSTMIFLSAVALAHYTKLVPRIAAYILLLLGAINFILGLVLGKNHKVLRRSEPMPPLDADILPPHLIEQRWYPELSENLVLYWNETDQNETKYLLETAINKPDHAARVKHLEVRLSDDKANQLDFANRESTLIACTM